MKLLIIHQKKKTIDIVSNVEGNENQLPVIEVENIYYVISSSADYQHFKHIINFALDIDANIYCTIEQKRLIGFTKPDYSEYLRTLTSPYKLYIYDFDNCENVSADESYCHYINRLSRVRFHVYNNNNHDTDDYYDLEYEIIDNKDLLIYLDTEMVDFIINALNDYDGYYTDFYIDIQCIDH